MKQNNLFLFIFFFSIIILSCACSGSSKMMKGIIVEASVISAPQGGFNVKTKQGQTSQLDPAVHGRGGPYALTQRH